MAKIKAPIGPSRLSRVLENLNRQPKPTLQLVKALNVKLASHNDHFGARHFVKEDLPRIQYANPGINVTVERLRKTKEESWPAEMVVQYQDGKETRLDLTDKQSGDIFTELMVAAGGAKWRKVKS